MTLQRIERQIIHGREFPYPPGTVCVGGESTSDFFNYSALTGGDVVNFPYPPTPELIDLLAQIVPNPDLLFVEPKLSELAGKILEAKNPGSTQIIETLPDGRRLRVAYGYRSGAKEGQIFPNLPVFLLAEILDPQRPEPEVFTDIRNWEKKLGEAKLSGNE